MATYDDVARFAFALPETTEGLSYGHRAWSVADKKFAWERPFSKADLARLGDEPVPGGPIIALTVEDLEEKEAVLAAGGPALFTIPHFDGFAAVLVRLDVVSDAALREALVDAWFVAAPSALAELHAGELR